MLFHDYHIFRVNSNKKFSPYKFYERLILELLKIFQSFFIIVYIYIYIYIYARLKNMMLDHLENHFE